MSVLASIANIKVPYASEGVIRTAQLDDTIAPTNSVQLAVNMNFDRVGAIQTRLGITQYADDLASEITNYGTLKNTIIPAGYTSLFQLGGTTIISQNFFAYPSVVVLSTTRCVIFWEGPSGVGLVQKFAIDSDTGIITGIGTPVTFDGTRGVGNKAVNINGTHVLNAWTGTSNHGFAQAFDVTADQVAAVGSAYEFDASNGQSISVVPVNSTHYIVFYTSSSNDGIATILAVDGTTYAVTEPGSPTTFESGTNFDNSAVALGDGTHFINFWCNFTGQAQAFSVNTGTWAITAIGSPLTFSTIGDLNSATPCVDGQHIVNTFQNNSGGISAQAFSVNLSTFAVTTVGTPVVLTTSVNDLVAVGFPDGLHFVAFYSENVGTGYAQLYQMNASTFNMSLIGSRLTGYDFANHGYTAAVDLNANKILTVWGNVAADEGQAAFFETFGNPVSGRWLYAGYSTKVANLPAGSTTWTDRRTGLAQVSKPRFSQYLNYIWMVNGNDQIGGDPVATSNGGNFGTDLVPTGFPKGDFINAGFEGRIWVVNKTLGIVYYSDIVQFTPPVSYTLSYNPQVNFISSLAPQTGETFTGLIQVPRALLIFTENTISRIYGASSVDAYPAYNVGTFSQESIVQTKTGIFFHHSSGFYQFDYGSQPIEISRRIIDFVKAIPHANYANIEGVYDGFDNVEWAVGSVTVEGVIFAQCMLRYTISTQVWTVYDYVDKQITAMIYYDDGTNLNHLAGTHAGKTGALETGFTDFGDPFYFEFIDRWRAYTEMYYLTKEISGVSVYSENAAGANLTYQKQKSGPNAWLPIGTVSEANNSIMPNSDTEDFDVMRFRLAGNTKGAQVVVHGIEISQLTIKGQETN